VAGATRTTVHLPDGSTVVLQPGSEIAYNGDFSSHRAVSLKGEGFFSVYHDAAHPFDVSTGKVNVTVLGTQFNINECIPSCITVTLVEGSIKCGTPKGSVKMKPGEQLSVTPSMQKLTVVDTDTVTAWKDGLLRFKSQPLEKIISELQIKHRVTIQLQTSETLRRTKLTASFSDKQNIGDILNVLSHSLPIRCQRVNENTYIIR
jgi:ferric-dicitrate binding protein FerR (iron transport regulator)